MSLTVCLPSSYLLICLVRFRDPPANGFYPKLVVKIISPTSPTTLTGQVGHLPLLPKWEVYGKAKNILSIAVENQG